MWKIWWAPNNASKWQLEFNLAFKGLRVKKYVQTLLLESVIEMDRLEDEGVDEREVFKWTLKAYDVNLIHLSLGRDQCLCF